MAREEDGHVGLPAHAGGGVAEGDSPAPHGAAMQAIAAEALALAGRAREAGFPGVGRLLEVAALEAAAAATAPQWPKQA